MKKYYGYIRVSTVRQGEQGVSLKEQREAIGRYAFRNDLPILSILEETKTAAKKGRPVFAQMLKALRDGKASGVIIHKIDRSARNLRDWADLGELLDGGVEVHFANEQMDLMSRSGRLSADIQAVVAADYIRNLREETIKGMYGRLKQGFYPLPAPLGYLNMGAAKPKTLDPERAPLIQKLFERYATGEHSIIRLQQHASELGLRMRSGSPVSVNTLANMLHNPFYMGIMHIRKHNQTFMGTHEPLISRYLFDSVQSVLHRKARYKVIKHDFLFRRFIRCAMCGRCLVGEIQKGLVYYACKRKACRGKMLRETRLDEQIQAILRSLQMSSDEQIHFEQQMHAREGQWAEIKKERLTALKARLESINDELAKLTQGFASQAIEPDIYELAKKRLLMERCEIQDTIQQTSNDESQNSPRMYREAVQFGNQALAIYKTGFIQEKRHMLRTIFSRCTFNGAQLDVLLATPFADLGMKSGN